MPTPSVDAARKRSLVERVQAGEGAEAGRARRLDGGAEPLDDRAGGRERDTRRRRSCGSGSSEDGAYDRLRPWPSGHVPGTVPGTWPAALGEALAGQLRAALGAVRRGSARRVSPTVTASPPSARGRGCPRARPPWRPARRPAAAARPDGAPPGSASRSSIQSRGGCTSMPVARVRRHERAPAAVLLHAQVPLRRPREHLLELVLVERDPQVVDARQAPVPRLDDDVDRAALELASAAA